MSLEEFQNESLSDVSYTESKKNKDSSKPLLPPTTNKIQPINISQNPNINNNSNSSGHIRLKSNSKVELNNIKTNNTFEDDIDNEFKIDDRPSMMDESALNSSDITSYETTAKPLTKKYNDNL